MTLDKFTGETIRGQYQHRFNPSGDWILRHEFQPLDLSRSLADLDTYKDRLIVFEAVPSSDTARYVSRLPLSPTAQSLQQAQADNAKQPSTPDIPSSVPQTTRDHHSEQLSPHSLGARAVSTPVAPAYTDDYRARAAWDKLPSNVHAAWEGVARRAAPQVRDAPTVKPQPLIRPSVAPSEPIVEPPLTVEELREQKEQSFQLQVLLKDASPETLETSVEQGVKILDRIKAPLISEGVVNSPDAQQWLQHIDALRKQAVKTKTIIGVVGNTGAGKSSVINAMLDEERLVPTNCMRACTAVVTEISFNHEREPYRAQIEFIGRADWEKELKVLFQDLLDGNGNMSRECANEDTDAGIAFAKIKAVYPRKTKEEIAGSSIPKLLQEVAHILGTTRDIKETNSATFYKRLQTFVDSKEKTTGIKEKKDKGRPKNKDKKEMEFWPLIRVVRIKVKSPALATGAVIVDLPGVHDANAARAAVAEGYMKQCTGLWIVAPINRAVDDKAAKSLLGDSFKRQLKMDGGFSSKTDDISLTEAIDSLGLDDETAPDYEELGVLKNTITSSKEELEELKNSKSVYDDILNNADEQIEVWEGLEGKLEDGKTVYKPKASTKKRKSGGISKPRKRLRKDSSDSDDSDDSEFKDTDSEDDDESVPDASQDHEPLTEEQISQKLQELKATKKEARTQKIEVLAKMDGVRKTIKDAKRAEEKIESSLSALCISGRNQYSTGAIRQDFAAGIKELDQEIAAEEDEENFNPDNDARDYEEVARSLPVFCVSSRGYQKLCGRLEKDAEVRGFTTKEQTEIPLLQAHCGKLTETGRSANCRAFLNKLSQLLNSMTMWASSDGSGANMTAEQRAREARFLHNGLTGLESGLDKTVQNAAKELQDEFQDNIYDKYEAAISAAISQSNDTARRWGMKVDREDRSAGGFCWSTYKAICRRSGVFTNSQGPHEWNAELAEPMMKQLAAGWEKTFSRRIPVVTQAFACNAVARLKTFHHDIEARARKIGASIANLSMLSQQVPAYEAIFRDFSSGVKDMILAHQKEINREFVPVVARHMDRAYEGCTDESGPGSFARMKAIMTGHVEQDRHAMFQASGDKVKNSLEGLIKMVEEQLGEKTDEVFVSMRRDYRAVLGAGESQGEILPRPQRLCRKEIKGVIEGVQKIFEKVVNGKLDEDDSQSGDVGDEKNQEEGDDKDADENETDTDGTAAKASQVRSDESEKQDGGNENGKEDELMADASSPDPTESKGEDDGDGGVGRDEKTTTSDTDSSDAGVQDESSDAGDAVSAAESPSNQLSSDSEH
ncbi:MAG: hypothetical protein Q9195_001777 [Heterodermia aff. obscurata]